MRYFKYEIHERIGEYENDTTSVMITEDDVNLHALSHDLAMEHRGAEPSDYDESMGAYWCDYGIAYPATLVELSRREYEVLRKHI